MALAKQLRLDPAQLTDVGRKREHNEDNMAYVIPKDPQVMAMKGALFIVADGMGGHAAAAQAAHCAIQHFCQIAQASDGPLAERLQFREPGRLCGLSELLSIDLTPL